MKPLAHWSRSRWNQLNELEDLQHSLGTLFRHSLESWPEEHLSEPQWIPLVTVSENARGYVLKADLPQVKQEDVKITLEDGTLTITGRRKFDQNRHQDQRVKRAYGRFAHSFVLPVDARPASVSAVFKNGVLTVHLARNDVNRAQRVAGGGTSAARIGKTSGVARPGHRTD